MNLIEVAKRAGVSKSTVSRVLNHKANVAASTVETVRRVVKELGYEIPLGRRRGRPSNSASGLRTGTFALFFPDADAGAMRTPLSARLAHGVEEALYEQNLSMMLSHLRDSRTLPPCFTRRQIDAAIIRGGKIVPEVQSVLAEFPCVWIFEPEDQSLPFDVVMPDNFAVGANALSYLMDLGCRQIACINGFAAHSGMVSREAAFLKVAESRGQPVAMYKGKPFDSLVDEMLAAGCPKGIFMPGSDAELARLVEILRSKGIRPVDDVKIICPCNSAAGVAALDSRLPNLDIQPEEIGRAAVELLLWRLAHPKKPPRRMAISPRIIVPGN